MSIGSKAKRDQKRKAAQRQKNINASNVRPKKAAAGSPHYSTSFPSNINEILDLQEKIDRLFSTLTTPTTISDRVLEFTHTLSNREPEFLNPQPELWSRQSCCDLNVAKYIEANGGFMVCGYRVWFNDPIYIEGERHAVWSDGTQLRDVSFVDSGETTILFVADGEISSHFDASPKKVRYAFYPADKAILRRYEEIESSVPRMEMSADDAWATMPSYEDWLAGKRTPNMFPATALRPR
jgi:hypothetical protein